MGKSSKSQEAQQARERKLQRELEAKRQQELQNQIIRRTLIVVLAAILLIVGILILYDKLKRRIYCRDLVHTVLEYAVPSLFILIGIMFLFHQEKTIDFIFIISGILTIAEGGVLLANALWKE